MDLIIRRCTRGSVALGFTRVGVLFILSVLETREKLSKKLRGHVNALKRVKSLARVL